MNSRKIVLILVLVMLLPACSGGYSTPEEPDVTDATFYRGTSLYFASYIENRGEIVYKENGVAKSPFHSVKDHGGNIVRLMVEPEIYENSYTLGEPPVDYLSFENMRLDFRKAHKAGLEVFLTIKPEKSVPRCWSNVRENQTLLGDSLYRWTYRVLDELGKEGLFPRFVSVGNEINSFFMTDGYDQYAEDMNLYNKVRNVYFFNRGADAVKAIATKYSKTIPVAAHIFSPEHVRWYMTENSSLNLKADIIALSYYYGWHKMGEWNNFKELITWLKTNYNKDFFLLETAVQWTSDGWSDNHVNTYHETPSGYVVSPEGQRKYLISLAKELRDAGSLGMIYWGGDWVGCNKVYIYPDQYGKGSSWENCTFWDLNNNLHVGIDWMKMK